uniref:FLYWCH-type domain-containing protein n=1 Tax=Ditylenchus dipsaci TaxID=166011 RepID=A0A915EW46_9BILA
MADIKSEKGKVMAVCGNYPMRKDYVFAKKLTQYWRCSMEGCHARAQSAFESLVLKETRSHDLCGGSPATIERHKGQEGCNVKFGGQLSINSNERKGRGIASSYRITSGLL